MASLGTPRMALRTVLLGLLLVLGTLVLVSATTRDGPQIYGNSVTLVSPGNTNEHLEPASEQASTIGEQEDDSEAVATTTGRRLMAATKQYSANNAFSVNPNEREELEQLRAQSAMMSKRLHDLGQAFNKAVEDRARLEAKLKRRELRSSKSADTAGNLQDIIAAQGKEKSGTFVVDSDGTVKSWKGYECTASEEEIELYLSYSPRKLCPDDWFFVQYLIYMKGCYALPKRNCLSRTPPKPVKPIRFPVSLFAQRSLANENVRWNLHWCKSFDCLNNRTDGGDCQNCFNMYLEKHRWQKLFRGSPPLKEVISMANIPLRLGLDAGGGTGSFAAHCALNNITVVTTSYNIETVRGRETHGVPFLEAIALRGLLPLHLPHQARLPFYDSTLDLVHCMNSIKFLSYPQFEFLIYEWDRVLRPGGIMWFELFYAPEEQMVEYSKYIDTLGYRKLYWNLTPKPQEAIVWRAPMVYLNCVLEKPVREDPDNEE